jgi:uncharacterized membrane protein
MKNHFKIFGIIALILAVAFLMFNCSQPGDNPPQKTYSIQLKNGDTALTAYNFVEGVRTPLTVTVVNTGTEATGKLSIEITGNDASNFTVTPSTLSLESIAKDGSETFTVAPHGTLTADQTYTATITVKGNNNINKSFTVSFKESSTPTYLITLMNDGAALTAHVFGEGDRSALTVTVENTGNTATGVLSIAIGGDGASAFTVSKTSITDIEVDGSETFTVAPHGNLTGGQTYNATITVTGDNNISDSFTVSFKESTTPKYSITLINDDVELSEHTFTGRTDLSVAVHNTGNQPTGALSIAITGNGASAFTVTPATLSLASIAVDGSEIFTVAPHGTLTGGQTYNATITVSGGENITAKSFTVSFTEPTDPTYGIELYDDEEVALSEYEFTVGNTTLTVTVKNTGNIATGALNIGKTGSNASSFTVSKTSITDITVDGTDTFTVGLTGTLTPGTTYTATITVSGGNDISESFSVSYRAPDAYGISLKNGATALTTYAFDSNRTELTVTVSNTGSAATGGLNIALSGTNADSFKVTPSSLGSIAVSGSNTFKVVPVDGLAAGDYSATITVSGGNDITAQQFTVSYTANVLNGLWYNQDVIRKGGPSLGGGYTQGSAGVPGVAYFDGPNFWLLNGFGYAWKGTFTTTGTDSGNYTLQYTRKKDNTNNYTWGSYTDTVTSTWTLSNDGNTLSIVVQTGNALVSTTTLVLTKTAWNDAANNTANFGPWQVKIDDPTLSSSIPLPPSEVDNVIINGLWVNVTLISGTSGTSGVWVFDYPNYWRLNNYGQAYKGTYDISGALSGSTYSGAYNITQTRSKDGVSNNWSWKDDAKAAENRTWSLSNDNQLTINGDVFVKMEWHDPANNSTGNNGPWQYKIGDAPVYNLVPAAPIPDGAGTLWQVPFTYLSTTNGNSSQTLNGDVWEITYHTPSASAADNGYAVITLTNESIPWPEGKGITDVKGIYYQYKTSETPTGNLITYVWGKNSIQFTVGSIQGGGDWKSVYITTGTTTTGNITMSSGSPADFPARLNDSGGSNTNFRLSIGVNSTTTGVLYLRELYFIF